MGPSLLSSLVAEDGWSSGDHSKKIDGIRDVQNVPLESSIDKLGDRDLLHEVVCLSRSKEMLAFLSEV
ncbi:hypothetical protein L3X38_023414 [Prunus dulcis]|uniref:Uncharacterized protein n=1 Tax=Prunus dulcis TaxID=3755 RepID=A0AAD4VYX7_PRUDU|nr:hypothetical protein L3X38_023414 [Prunus dulcis]